MRYKVKLLNPLEHSLWSLSQGSSVRFDRSLYALRLKGETGNAPKYPVISLRGASRFNRSDIISRDFDPKGLLKDA